MTSLLNETGTKKLGQNFQTTKNPKNNITGSKRAGTNQRKSDLIFIKRN